MRDRNTTLGTAAAVFPEKRKNRKEGVRNRSDGFFEDPTPARPADLPSGWLEEVRRRRRGP
jgi:hypothetical protein